MRVPVRRYVHPGVWIKVAVCDRCGLRSVTWRKPQCGLGGRSGDRRRYCVACIGRRVRAGEGEAA